MSTDSIVDIIFIVLFLLCSLSMVISTIWFISKKKKLDKEFLDSLRDISKESSDE